MIYLIAHIVDGFGHGANVFGCNMNEYRHMTYRVHFCPRNNFTDGTPYNGDIIYYFIYHNIISLTETL